MESKNELKRKNMNSPVIIYTEYVNSSLLESMLFSVAKHVRANRQGNILEFMIDNCLYNLTIAEADAAIVKEDLADKEIDTNGLFYSISLTSAINEEVNRQQLDKLVALIESVMPICGVVK
jgi:hypothetical protein